jgi:hypothetical protein
VLAEVLFDISIRSMIFRDKERSPSVGIHRRFREEVEEWFSVTKKLKSDLAQTVFLQVEVHKT